MEESGKDREMRNKPMRGVFSDGPGGVVILMRMSRAYIFLNYR